MKSVFGVVAIAVLAIAGGCQCTKSDVIKGGEPASGEAPVVSVPPAPKLPVELYVMSQCPYGVQAENVLIPLAMEMKDSIDLKLFFVGDEEEPGVPGSLHGETEVRSNLLQICTMKHAPEKTFDLILCMNEDMQAMPGNFEACAARLEMDPGLVVACADGQEGRILLLESYRKGDSREVRGSPTIFINDVEYDGPGTPIGIMRALCSGFGDRRPALCSELPEPVKLRLTVVTDSRCLDCAKYVEVAPKQIAKIFPGVETTVLDYVTPEGKEAYKALAGTDYRFLPAFLFEQKVKDDPAFAQLAPYMMELGDQMILVFEATFDPLAEICDNKVDDDGNGRIDCADKACKLTLACAPEKKKSLEVFVMSQCPYGAEAILSLREFLAAFSGKVDLKVRFLASEPFPGQFQSLHGPGEVAEDLRQICAQKHYGKGMKFMEYLYCRAADYQSEDWEKCATGPIRADVIRKCAEGEEGRKLLSADVKHSEAFQINGSPTWIANNRSRFNGISPADIQKGYCAVNEGLKPCEVKLSGDAAVPAGACGQ